MNYKIEEVRAFVFYKKVYFLSILLKKIHV